MGSVIQLREPDDIGRLRDKINEAKASSWNRRTVDNGGGPPHNGDMEARVSKLEAIAETTRDKIAGVESRLTIIEKTMASKEDMHREIGSLRAEMHKEINLQTWRIIGACAVLVAAVYFISTNVK